MEAIEGDSVMETSLRGNSCTHGTGFSCDTESDLVPATVLVPAPVLVVPAPVLITIPDLVSIPALVPVLVLVLGAEI